MKKDPSKESIKNHFSAAASTYDGMATLQRKVGEDLLNTFVLTDFSGTHLGDVIVDIGCGTGFITQELSLLSQVLAIDIALPMLQVARAKIGPVNSIHYVCADIESLPMPHNSAHKIVSNLALQWCQNLPDLLSSFVNILTQNGQIFFSTFGVSTLHELKDAWAKVDDYNHVNDFHSEEEINLFLKQAGFSTIQVETKYYQINYPSVIDLMKELKGIGANHVLAGRNKKTTSKGQMQKMLANYERKNEQISATYEIIFASACVEK